MFKQFKILLLLTLVSLSISKTDWGSCPSTLKEGEEFRVNAYLGKWYEIARHKSTPFQKGDCGVAEYSLNEKGNIKVYNTEKTPEKTNSITGEASKTDDPFRFKIAFGDFPFNKLFKGDYRVIDTDYNNFALVYSCADFYLAKQYTAYILSRTPELPQAFLDRIFLQLEKFDLPKEEFRFDIQTSNYCGNH